MKMLFIVLLFLTCKGWCQTSLKDQLQKIFSEAEKGFSAFKGTIKSISKSGDTIYQSNFSSEGTYDSEIQKSLDTESRELSCTIDSSDSKGAKKAVELWKRKLKAALDNSFKIKKINQHYASGSAIGYDFRANELQILLFYTTPPHTKSCSIAHIIILKRTNK